VICFAIVSLSMQKASPSGMSTTTMQVVGPPKSHYDTPKSMEGGGDQQWFGLAFLHRRR